MIDDYYPMGLFCKTIVDWRHEFRIPQPEAFPDFHPKFMS